MRNHRPPPKQWQGTLGYTDRHGDKWVISRKRNQSNQDGKYIWHADMDNPEYPEHYSSNNILDLLINIDNLEDWEQVSRINNDPEL